MRNWFLVLFYFGLSYCGGVIAQDDQLVKRGTFPFMAFIYYSDESMVDEVGARFIRSAVLIRTNWLVTSALGQSVIDSGFPKKTLLARLGAVTIDGNFTLNEDEDEQEREVIQIVRPYNHSATQWWTTDISLLKTLLPFNITSAVAIKDINVKRSFEQKTCIILVFAKKYANRTDDDKALIQLNVEVLPGTLENCGSLYSEDTMTCAADSDENKDVYDPNFCQGNSGGPLICDGEVMGLQTYINNNCKQPHLYQLLSAWDNFITCGIEDKCMEEQCGNICDVTSKDQATVTVKDFPTPTELTSTTKETMIPEGEIAVTTIKTVIVENTESSPTTKRLTPTSTLTGSSDTTETKSWPKESTDARKKMDDNERSASVEAQMEDKKRSASERNMCFVQTIVFGLLMCLF